MRQEQLESIMAQAIGQEQAQMAVAALMDKLGGAEVYIPTGEDAKRATRNQEMRRMYRSGALDIPGLALRYGISESQVRRVVGV